MNTRQRTGLITITICLTVAGIWLSARNSGPVTHTYSLDALGPQLSVDRLDAMADIVALVEPIGQSDQHWNNASNTKWEGPPESGTLPLVVSDHEVIVLQAIRGTAVGEHLIIRTAGGTVGDTTFVLEDGASLATGLQYLVFLENVEAPTQEGFDYVLSPILQGQGVFTAGQDGILTNVFGVTTSVADAAAE